MSVRNRLVYYLGGFDTRSARFYHQLYCDEARLQQEVNQCEYEVGDLNPSGPHSASWSIRTREGDRVVDTRYTFLQWNDIVREHWPRSSTRVALSIPAFFWRYAANGGIAKTWRLSRPFAWMLLLPLLYAMAAIFIAALAAVGAAQLSSRWAPAEWAPAAPAVAAAVAVIAVLAGGVFASEHQRVFWLMRAWTFLLLWGREGPQPWQQRWDEFAAKIEEDLEAGPVDEVLVIGHSAGAMVAIAVAERWLALGKERERAGKVKLVTLGNATPMLAIIPEAAWFRRQIEIVGASRMPWIDYTAPSDVLCYALVDPFSSCGLPVPSRTSYRVKSARFDKMFKPENYAKVRRDYFRIHFQYLMATSFPVENDFFRLTAGSHPLVVDASAH